MDREITEQQRKKFNKIIDESIKLTLFDRLITLEKESINDIEFSKEVRKILNIIKK